MIGQSHMLFALTFTHIRDGGDGTVYAVLEGLEVSLSKVKHWDQHLEFYAENDEIISASQQVKRIVSQLVQIASA